jgi:hypothetical protein
MMIPIALCSLVAVATIIERFFFFRRIRKKNRGEEVIELVRKGRTHEALHIIDDAEEAGNRLPVMRVLFVIHFFHVSLYPAQRIVKIKDLTPKTYIICYTFISPLGLCLWQNIGKN